MLTTAALVSLIAMSGWLFLNWRALQSQGLSLQTKLTFAAAWVGIFVVVAFLFSRLAG
jgi:hypothetical protein